MKREFVTFLTAMPDGIEFGHGDPDNPESPAFWSFARVVESTSDLHERIAEHLDLVTSGQEITRANGERVLAQAARLAQLSMNIDQKPFYRR